MLRSVACAIAAAMLAACAVAPPSLTTGTASAVVDQPFELSGRLSARHASNAAAANFRWMHGPDRDQLVLATPLGSTLARIEGSASSVRLELPDGRVAEAADWSSLTSEVLGAPIPVRGLAWWVRGVPHPGSAHTIERDASARASVLWQDGWEIVYSYGDAGGARPARLRLTYPETELRLVLDSWSDQR